jgi:hypothetical protein
VRCWNPNFTGRGLPMVEPGHAAFRWNSIIQELKSHISMVKILDAILMNALSRQEQASATTRIYN